MSTSGSIRLCDSKTDMTTKWEIQGARALLAQSPLPVLYSPPFGDGQWQLKLSETLSGEHQGKIGIYLMALRSEDDVRRATSELAWKRAKDWTATFKIYALSMTTHSSKKQPSTQPNVTFYFEKQGFDSDSFIHGRSNACSRESLRAKITKEDCITVHCSLTSNSNSDCELPYHRPINPLGDVIFDNPETADVVFTFPGKDSEPERQIYANKAVLVRSCEWFATHFASESASNDPVVYVDPYAPRLTTGEDYAPDEDNMGYLDKEDTVGSPASVDSETPAPPQDGNAAADPAQALPATEPVQKPVTDRDTSDREMNNAEPPKDTVEEVGMETRHKKRRKTEEKTEEVQAQPQLRRMIRIEPTHPFLAFRAFLAYLHTGSLPLTALPSEYVVARADALDEFEGAKEDFDFPPRGEWLRTQFNDLKGQPDWKGVMPCSPHALYRTAIGFECGEVQKIALSRIARSLTVENASYELVSPLSQEESEEVENAIFPFFRSHFNEVKNTVEWRNVVEWLCEGKIPAAKLVFRRMFRTMEFPKVA